MAEFQTSFIPKKPLAEERAPKPRRANLLNLVAFLVFLAAVVAAGGSYFYKAYLQSSLKDKTAQLERAKAAFEPSLIQDLKTLDRRINSVQEILNSHLVVSPIFESLQDLTLKSIQFNRFSLEIGRDAAGKIEVKMSGRSSPAGGYRSIALQSDKLTENKYFKDIIFSNLSLSDRGGVNFDLTFNIDRTMVLYPENLNRLTLDNF
jgi:hypothetical protein